MDRENHNEEGRKGSILIPLEESKFRYDECGNFALAARLKSLRLNNDISKPIRCTLYSRRSGGYLFEVSPQLGCKGKCFFCACGKFVGDLVPEEVVEEIKFLQKEAESRGIYISGPCQIVFTGGGELLLNPWCLEILEAVTSHFPADLKISTVFPAEECVRENLRKILDFMKNYPYQVKLQISLSSTDAETRQKACKFTLAPFEEIKKLGEEFVKLHPVNRKITLTFALMDNSRCCPNDITSILSPDYFVITLYPYRENVKHSNIKSISPDVFRKIIDAFRSKYMVIAENDNHVFGWWKI